MTYGFDPQDAPLELGGTHLTPQQFHDSMQEENSVIIDVRNFNETAIGRFQPPSAQSADTKVCVWVRLWVGEYECVCGGEGVCE